MDDIFQKILSDYGNEEKCRIRDPAAVASKLRKIVQDGVNKLQIITDHDFTLTRSHKDGEHCYSSMAIIEICPLTPAEYREKAMAAFEKYYKIEIDVNMPVEEKIPYMIEWIKHGEKLMVDYKLTRNHIRDLVKRSATECPKVLFKDLASEVFSFLNNKNVPITVISAGNGTILEDVFTRDNLYLPNVKVISNFMVFNDDGTCLGYKEPLVHMFNKNAVASLGHAEYFKGISDRTNVVLMGDTIGDLQMSDDLPETFNVLKIGFLNDKIDERLPSFLDGFDVVLVDDQSFKMLDVILKNIQEK